MSAYLLDHPPRRRQYRVGRRARPTGTLGRHSFEIAPDLHGADLGAEKGASIIQRRTDAAGSYHLLGDRDSEILLVPLDDRPPAERHADHHHHPGESGEQPPPRSSFRHPHIIVHRPAHL